MCCFLHIYSCKLSIPFSLITHQYPNKYCSFTSVFVYLLFFYFEEFHFKHIVSIVILILIEITIYLNFYGLRITSTSSRWRCLNASCCRDCLPYCRYSSNFFLCLNFFQYLIKKKISHSLTDHIEQVSPKPR